MQPLPREIIKWLQSLDLSFAVKNPKRDFANGYLTAEILSRYYVKDINMNNYENGTRLAAKVDNWEQIYKFCKKRGVQISKHLIDPVIHCAPGAAEALVFHLYNLMTKRSVKQFEGTVPNQHAVPAFMRDTASRRLKDPEIDRIQDNISRTIAAIDTLGYYHAERREQKASEAPLLISKERKMKLGVMEEDLEESSKEDLLEASEQVEEVTVKAMSGEPNQLKSRREPKEPSKPVGQSPLVKAVSSVSTSAGALANMQQPTLLAKPANDIMRPLIINIMQECPELKAAMDPSKDVVTVFLEQCQREVVPEDVSVRVFETLANRAQLLVDTLMKSPPEFWKVWMTFFPAITTFSESSSVFGSAVFFFKRLGDLMRETDPALTQHLVAEVGLPAVAKELVRSPEKRECLCEIIYSYTQEDTLSRLFALRALKEKLGDDLPVYVTCLSCLIALDAQLGLLDEHLLDLYIYYALVGMQSPRPRIRVAGLSILSTIAISSSQHASILQLLPNFQLLASDEWWEVQAQLLQLCAGLLHRIAATDRHADDPNPEAESGSQHNSHAEEDDAELTAHEEAADGLLQVVNRLFVVNGSKNVLQVGLSSLVHLLQDYPQLLPIYVSVLLEQPANLRQRLLSPSGNPGDATGTLRLTYVMGNLSKMYEEKFISSLWPHLDVAKTLAMQLEASPLEQFELEHTEVLLASLPPRFEEDEAEEWLNVFEKVSRYVFGALIDPDLHPVSVEIVGRFWLSEVELVSARSLAGSKGPLLQAMVELCSSQRPVVEESAVVDFLRSARGHSAAAVEIDSLVESFRETYPDMYASSGLRDVLQ
jgi:hypothetical protein